MLRNHMRIGSFEAADELSTYLRQKALYDAGFDPFMPAQWPLGVDTSKADAVLFEAMDYLPDSQLFTLLSYQARLFDLEMQEEWRNTLSRMSNGGGNLQAYRVYTSMSKMQRVALENCYTKLRNMIFQASYSPDYATYGACTDDYKGVKYSAGQRGL